ncbi:hypothetical protein J2I47_19100 [Fibrella sp. HMF5335]|uniref:Uncharacterized protein n=1 Tax=Fibrella rubiginis TaxID=2817060 RepID=A0A939GGE4_9BACT|nr:hypothetical protein [Fibrella rubiginis]MBO0938667.1 hypothetical protein [Fibrella rubiginis]
MNPPYSITTSILKAVATISEKIGEVNANFLTKQSPELRKQNRIQTIQASLGIEGNTLSTDQITAILENKRVLGPWKDIQEVMNAIAVYDRLSDYKPADEKSFLAAHKQLMAKLLPDAGAYRRQGVGIIKSGQVEHVAPPRRHIQRATNNLFV